MFKTFDNSIIELLPKYGNISFTFFTLTKDKTMNIKLLSKEIYKSFKITRHVWNLTPQTNFK